MTPADPASPARPDQATPLAGQHLLLVGCGKMGGAMLVGWLGRGLPATNLLVVDPEAHPPPGVEVITPEAAATRDPAPDICILAVKPQMIAGVLPLYRPLVRRGTVFLSVAAGTTLAGLSAILGPEAGIVRAMPNTPSAIGKGMTVLCANDRVPPTARQACESLMSAVGTVARVDDEALMDAVTAVSGSGPAYVFALAETLAEAGVRAGLPADLAAALARQTVIGAGALLEAMPEDPATLRRNVTSPGGTTAAALEHLLDPNQGLTPLMDRAVTAAARRSRELAS